MSTVARCLIRVPNARRVTALFVPAIAPRDAEARLQQASQCLPGTKVLGALTASTTYNGEAEIGTLATLEFLDDQPPDALKRARDLVADAVAVSFEVVRADPPEASTE